MTAPEMTAPDYKVASRPLTSASPISPMRVSHQQFLGARELSKTGQERAALVRLLMPRILAWLYLNTLA